AYIIRVLRKQLDQFEVHSSSERIKATSSNVLNEIERIRAFKETISERLGPPLRKEAERNAKLRNEARAKVQGFSGIHPTRRSDPLLVDNFEALTEPKKRQERAAPLKDYKGTVRVRLSEDDLKQLSINPSLAADFKKIDTKSFSDLMRSKLGGID